MGRNETNFQEKTVSEFITDLKYCQEIILNRNRVRDTRATLLKRLRRNGFDKDESLKIVG